MQQRGMERREKKRKIEGELNKKKIKDGIESKDKNNKDKNSHRRTVNSSLPAVQLMVKGIKRKEKGPETDSRNQGTKITKEAVPPEGKQELDTSPRLSQWSRKRKGSE